MPLKVRPTGLGSEIDKERQDYTVYIGKWAVDRVYDVQVQGSPEGLRWFWSFSQHGPMMRSGRVSAFEEGAVSGELGSVEGWAKLEEAPLRHAGRTLDEFSSRGKPGP